jgi:hypothetical protein
MLNYNEKIRYKKEKQQCNLDSKKLMTEFDHLKPQLNLDSQHHRPHKLLEHLHKKSESDKADQKNNKHKTT